MTDKKDTGKFKDEKKEIEKIEIESDERFNVKEEVEEQKEEKKEKPKIGFGSKDHIKSIKKKQRTEKWERFFRRWKIKFPNSFILTIVSSLARFLDYALNFFILITIVFSIWMGVTSLLDDNWIRVLCSGFMIIILTWLNEKII